MRTLAETNERLEEVNKELLRRIAELEAQIANAQKLADVLLDERNEEVKKVAYWSKAYDDAKRGAWNAAIEAAIEKMKTFGKPYWTREETIELLEGITQ